MSTANRPAVSHFVGVSVEIKRLTPPRILRATSALNCAYTLFTDSLYDNKTEYGSLHRTSEVFATGHEFFALKQQTMSNFNSGDEYTVVDEFARALKLNGWLEWSVDESEIHETGR